MISRAKTLDALVVFILLAVMLPLLFSDYLFSIRYFAWPRSLAEDIEAMCRDPALQWIVVSGLSVHLGMLAYVQRKGALALPDVCLESQEAWLAFFMAAVLVTCASSFPTSGQPTGLPTLMVCIFVARWARSLIGFRASAAGISCRRLWTLKLLGVMLATAAFWRRSGLPSYGYQGKERWTGVWENPNIYGLLMGVGFVIGLMFALQGIRANPSAHGIKSVSFDPLVFPFFVAVMAMAGLGLVKSYCRGAWVGTVVALAVLARQKRVSRTDVHRRIEAQIPKVWRYLTCIALSFFALVLWNPRAIGGRAVWRAGSIVNENDFSWRNRIAAWEGALQITADHMAIGVGWSQTESLYDRYYLSPKLAEGAAIKINDYLLLGATLGIPTLFCLAMYLWLGLKQESEGHSLKAFCRCAIIVLAVGFWFDGGLFRLATASTFWILLELGQGAG